MNDTFNSHRTWVVSIAGSLTLAATGCQPKSPQRPTEKMCAGGKSDVPANRPAADSPAAKSQHAADSREPKPEKPAPPLTIPAVSLSSSLLATCVVNVGDTVPEGEL